MAESRHFCPDCGSIDIRAVDGSDLISTPGSRTMECPNCSWKGPISDTLGAVSSEAFWDIERVGDVLIRVLAKHGAGPLVQVLEFVGLLPRMKTVSASDDLPPKEVLDKLAAYNEIVQRCRDAVMREIFTAAITAAFEAAEKANKDLSAALGIKPHEIFTREVV